MSQYDSVARREKERQDKGKGRVPFKPVIYGEEKRCKTCWFLLSDYEYPDGRVEEYCYNCNVAMK